MEINIQDLVQHANTKMRANKADELRKKYGDKTIVLLEVGDYYETYGEGAVQMAQTLGVTLRYSGNIKEAAFPKRTADTYFPKLVRSGYKICVMTKGSF